MCAAGPVVHTVVRVESNYVANEGFSISGCCVVELTGEQVEKSMTHEFQSTLVKCTWEDRNRIGRRLRGLMEYIESRQRTLHL